MIIARSCTKADYYLEKWLVKKENGMVEYWKAWSGLPGVYSCPEGKVLEVFTSIKNVPTSLLADFIYAVKVSKPYTTAEVSEIVIDEFLSRCRKITAKELEEKVRKMKEIYYVVDVKKFIDDYHELCLVDEDGVKSEFYEICNVE